MPEGDTDMEEVADCKRDSDITPASGEGARISASKKADERVNDNVKAWHLRLGHSLPVKAVKRHVNEGLLPQVSCANVYCDVCLRGKFKLRFNGSLTRSTEPDTLNFDTKEKIETESSNGHQYFVTIIE